MEKEKKKDEEKLKKIPKDPEEDEEKNEKRNSCEEAADMMKYPISHNDPPENKERGNWSNPVEFILSCLGYAIGLGNVWRFPYIVYKYGGGSFMFAYWIVFILVAFPSFYLELSLGQFNSRGPLHVYRNLIPAFEGIGWATLLVQFNSAIYYNGIHAWAIYYLFSSFTAHWKHCDSDWNSPHCFAMKDYQECRGNFTQFERWYVKGQCYHDSNASLLLDHLSNCYEKTLSNADRMLDSDKRWHNCSFAFFFTFNQKNSAEHFLLGENHTAGLEKKPACDPKEEACVFQTEDLSLCEAMAVQKKPITDVKGKQLLDFRFRDSLPIDEVEKRAAVLKTQLKSGTHRNFRDMLMTYCSKNFGTDNSAQLRCLRKILKPDESFSSEEYYRMSINAKESSFSDLRGFYWPLPLCLVLAWIIVGVGTWGGPKWIGKIVYFTALFPCVMIVVLVIISVTLDGHSEGVAFYLETRWCELANPMLWLTATGQIFFSLSIGGGGLMTLASFNRFHNDLLRDSLIVALGNCVFSFISGFGVFGVIGFMARIVGADVGEVLRGSSEGIAFVTYAQATAGFQGGEVVAFLFFFMLVLLAVDSAFAMVETLLTAMFDEFPFLLRRKAMTMIVFCCFFFCLSLPHVTRGGSKMVGTIDSSSYDFLVPLCTIAELMTIICFYGLRNMIEDIKMMTGVNMKESAREKDDEKANDKQPKEPTEDEKAKAEGGAEEKKPDEVSGSSKRSVAPELKKSFHMGRCVWSSPIRYYFYFSWVVCVPLGISFLFFAVIITKYILGENERDIWENIVFWMIGGAAFPLMLILGLCWNLLVRKRTFKECFRPTEDYGPPLNENRFGRYKKIPETEHKTDGKHRTVI